MWKVNEKRNSVVRAVDPFNAIRRYVADGSERKGDGRRRRGMTDTANKKNEKAGKKMEGRRE